MKIATIIGICALASATALGCSGASSGGSGSGTGDNGGDGTSSGSSGGTSSSSGSSGGTASSSGSSGGTASSSGSSGSSGSSSGAASPSDGGGVTNSDAAPMDDPETDYTETKTITMDSFVVPANGEVFYCQSFANPWGAQVDIKTYSLDMSTGSHHMFAFYQNGATNGAVAMCPSGGLTFGAFTFTAQSPTLTQTYPTTVGATIPAGTGFNMMVHYLNTGTTPLTTHVSLTMYVAKKNVVTQHAGVIFLNDAAIVISPSNPTATTSYTLPQDVNIMSSDSHMHKGATSFVSTATNAAGSTQLFATNEWSEPAALVYSPPLKLTAGTKITWTCQYPGATTTRYFGESAQTNVMCISTSIFYPVSDVTNPVLGSAIGGLL